MLEIVLGRERDLERLTFEVDDRAAALGDDHLVPTDHVGQQQDHDGQTGQREEQPAGHPTGSTRKPTPRSAVIEMPPSSLRRIAATCASSVFVGPNHWPPQTCSMISERRRAAPGSSQRNAQDVELLRRQVDLLIIEEHPTRAPVDPYPSADELGVVRCGLEPGPLGQGSDAGQELPDAERLDEVVVGTELEAEHAVDLGARGTDDDDREIGRARPQDPAHLAPVEIGQGEVEENQIGGLCRERAGAVGGELHVVPRGRQGLRHHTGQGAVVLDQQDAHARSVSVRVRPIGFL